MKGMAFEVIISYFEKNICVPLNSNTGTRWSLSRDGAFYRKFHEGGDLRTLKDR